MRRKTLLRFRFLLQISLLRTEEQRLYLNQEERQNINTWINKWDSKILCTHMYVSECTKITRVVLCGHMSRNFPIYFRCEEQNGNTTFLLLLLFRISIMVQKENEEIYSIWTWGSCTHITQSCCCLSVLAFLFGTNWHIYRKIIVLKWLVLMSYYCLLF